MACAVSRAPSRPLSSAAAFSRTAQSVSRERGVERGHRRRRAVLRERLDRRRARLVEPSARPARYASASATSPASGFSAPSAARRRRPHESRRRPSAAAAASAAKSAGRFGSAVTRVDGRRQHRRVLLREHRRQARPSRDLRIERRQHRHQRGLTLGCGSGSSPDSTTMNVSGSMSWTARRAAARIDGHGSPTQFEHAVERTAVLERAERAHGLEPDAGFNVRACSSVRRPDAASAVADLRSARIADTAARGIALPALREQQERRPRCLLSLSAPRPRAAKPFEMLPPARAHRQQRLRRARIGDARERVGHGPPAETRLARPRRAPPMRVRRTALRRVNAYRPRLNASAAGGSSVVTSSGSREMALLWPVRRRGHGGNGRARKRHRRAGQAPRPRGPARAATGRRAPSAAASAAVASPRRPSAKAAICPHLGVGIDASSVASGATPSGRPTRPTASAARRRTRPSGSSSSGPEIRDRGGDHGRRLLAIAGHDGRRCTAAGLGSRSTRWSSRRSTHAIFCSKEGWRGAEPASARGPASPPATPRATPHRPSRRLHHAIISVRRSVARSTRSIDDVHADAGPVRHGNHAVGPDLDRRVDEVRLDSTVCSPRRRPAARSSAAWTGADCAPVRCPTRASRRATPARRARRTGRAGAPTPRGRRRAPA